MQAACQSPFHTMPTTCSLPHASVRCPAQVRVWSVPAGAVLCAATVQQDVVTRVLFGAPHGQRLVVGTLRGRARHYEFNGQVRRVWGWAPWDSRAGADGQNTPGLAHGWQALF